MQVKTHKILFIGGVFVAFLPVAFIYHLFFSASHPTPERNCDIQHSSCTQTLPDRVIVFDVMPKPVKALVDLTFRIETKGSPLNSDPYIDLGMPGMDMGPNRVRLHAVSPSVFEGKGIIVRCPTGKTVWRASVTIPESGSIDFIFNVIH